MQISEASLLEENKENIQQLPEGRSVSGLIKTFQQGPSFKQEELKQQRALFETQLKELEDLDDPLQVFIDYIAWCHEKYPQGNNVESGLLSVLQRCTTFFKDYEDYRNDSRYLKIWLEYARYTDTPLDIFVYLAKKEIGRGLALYYEEFAKLLEVQAKYNDASSVYEFGISINARPVPRLLRSLYEFQQRKVNYSNDKSNYDLPNVLTLKRGTNPLEQPSSVLPKKSKINVLQDDGESSMAQSLFTTNTKNVKDLGSIALRKKENKVKAKPWEGEILLQKRPTLNGSQGKIPVYRDTNIPHDQNNLVIEPSITHETIDDNIVTIVKKPAKPIDRVMVNTQLIYQQEEEMSLLELFIKSKTINLPREHSTTVILPLKDDDSTLIHPPQSPTMTLYSRMAHNEVFSMFNQASKNMIEDDERSEANSTNYDGFVTETFHKGFPITHEMDHVVAKVTPPQNIPSTQSSPFIEHPSRIISSGPEDPLLLELRTRLLSSLSPPLESYPGYNNSKTLFIEAIRKFRSITDSKTKIIKSGGPGSIVNFCGDSIYSLKCELGKGGFGYVYLIENEIGDLKALKAETQSSNWEFYILTQIHRRLEHNNAIMHRVINPESLYLYKDESFLILPYLKQGTLLDVVNFYKTKNESMEEVLCVFFTVELLKVIEKLHSIGIIHGDLKADNCMIDVTMTQNLSSVYHRSGEEGWDNQKLVLIDFGRSVDLTLFSEGKQFLTSFKTDQQDCPLMNKHEPWSFEADYYGIAAIIHTLLFGKYIEINELKNGKYKLKEPLKRYWQRDELWNQFFDILLNTYYNNNINEKYPIIDELKYQRNKFETWLEANSSQQCLKRVLNDLEVEMNKLHRRKIGR